MSDKQGERDDLQARIDLLELEYDNLCDEAMDALDTLMVAHSDLECLEAEIAWLEKGDD